MEKPPKYIFVKFHIEEKLQMMDNMIISEERNVIDNWDGKKSLSPRFRKKKTKRTLIYFRKYRVNLFDQLAFSEMQSQLLWEQHSVAPNYRR